MSDYTPQVREYLAYCRRAAAELEARGSNLDPKYHPTEAGCLKLVHGDAKAIRQAYREVTAAPVSPVRAERDAA